MKLIHGLEVFLAFFGIGLDCSGIGLPVGRTNLAMFLNKLESFYESQSFLDASTDWQVVYAQLSQYSVLVDYEETTQCDSGVLDQHVVRRGDVFVEIGEQRVAQITAKSTLLPRSVYPRQVTEVRVRRHSDYLSIQCLEIRDLFAERQQLGRAHECAGKFIISIDSLLNY